MVDPLALRRFGYRALFVGLCSVIAFMHLLPFHVGVARFATPDLPVLLAFAWVLRRPDYVPALLVAGVMLALDVLFMRPLGLWAAITVLGVEFLRGRGRLSADLPFLVEWLLVGVTFGLMTVANSLALAVLLAPYPAIGPSMLQILVSAAFYPLVVAASGHLMAVRPASPAEREAARAAS